MNTILHSACADCAQIDGCPPLGHITANSPFVLENLSRLRDAKKMRQDIRYWAAHAPERTEKA